VHGKPKPQPWNGHKLTRELTTLELLLITKKKVTVLGRILLSDAVRKKVQEKYETQGW